MHIPSPHLTPYGILELILDPRGNRSVGMGKGFVRIGHLLSTCSVSGVIFSAGDKSVERLDFALNELSYTI